MYYYESLVTNINVGSCDVSETIFTSSRRCTERGRDSGWGQGHLSEHVHSHQLRVIVNPTFSTFVLSLKTHTVFSLNCISCIYQLLFVINFPSKQLTLINFVLYQTFLGIKFSKQLNLQRIYQILCSFFKCISLLSKYIDGCD